jgi:cytosine permease
VHQDEDDYALVRVPPTARYSWWSMAIQRFGQASSLAQLILGAALGFGMSFWGAFLTYIVASVIVEFSVILVGIIGMREGLTASVLSRWTGFGRSGSAVIGLLAGISLTGWFGIQSGVGARGLALLMPQVPEWAWSLLIGLGVTFVALRGFGSMAKVAYVTVPLFVAVIAWSVGTELTRHNLATLIYAAPPGPAISLVKGTLIVAGGGILQAVLAADMTRFNRSAGDVVKQTVIGLTGGQLLLGMCGVVLAHAVGTPDVSAIVFSSVGWIGILVVVAGTIKINDWNLYSAGLGVVNFISVAFRRQVSRALVTAVIGVVGTLLAAGGFLNSLQAFLGILAYLFSPICGITVAEYFVVRQWRKDLEDSRRLAILPESAPNWVPAAMLVWLAAAAIGAFIPVGFGSINALILAFLLYVAVGKLGLVRGQGIHRTAENSQPPTLVKEA